MVVGTIVLSGTEVGAVVTTVVGGGCVEGEVGEGGVEVTGDGVVTVVGVGGEAEVVKATVVGDGGEEVEGTVVASVVMMEGVVVVTVVVTPVVVVV